jgi:hypothetical protein
MSGFHLVEDGDDAFELLFVLEFDAYLAVSFGGAG